MLQGPSPAPNVLRHPPDRHAEHTAVAVARDLALHLDPDLEREAKRQRDRRFNVVDLPRHRALGFGLLLLLVGLHQRFVSPAPAVSAFGVGTFALALVLYNVLSFAALARWYRLDARINLGRLFLLADIVPLAAAITATGGSASWLFFAPYVRVFDQLHIGVRWCLTCAAVASAAHLATILLEQNIEGHGAFSTELFKLGSCTALALYLSMTAMTAERLRRRNSRTVAVARDLVRALEEQKTTLEHSRAEAESAAVAKGNFLATMSHEIRTPMNGILGMIDLAQGTDVELERQELLATAHTSAQALLQMLGDVLDFSKIEAGHMRVETTRVDVREVVQHSLQLISVLASAKGLALRRSVAPDVPAAVIGDPLRTRQVLLNLLGNAVKFSERGSVELQVSTRMGADGHRTLQYAVRDTGIGIAPEHHAAVFEAFTQAEMSTSRRFGGTGLGLSISRRLAELMGGALTVDSALGIGSTFTLSVPCIELRAAEVAIDQEHPVDAQVAGAEIAALQVARARVSEAQPTAPPAPLPRLRTTTPPRRTARPLAILLVEDNLVNQRVARLLLERWGHSVSVANNGLEALEALDAARFDVVLMDMQMPELDGVEATRRIRAQGISARSGTRLPILAMTANSLEDDRERCVAAGMDEFVAKPIDVERLFSLLEVVGARPAGAAA
jgi:signal transduction histidine kinase/ActR/RegA family two-component response regulator